MKFSFQLSLYNTATAKAAENPTGRHLYLGKLNQLLSEYKAVLEVSDSGETYPVLWRKTDAMKEESFNVPAGQVIVLGDNRSNAVDSRHFGYLPLSDITGIAKQVFISTNGGVERAGKVLDLN